MMHPDRIHLHQFLAKALGLIPTLPSLIEGLILNNTAKKTSKISIGSFLMQAVSKYPHRPFLHYEDASFTYGQFNERVNQWAYFFQQHNIQHGDKVAIMIENRPELVEIVYALIKIGAVNGLVNTQLQGEVLTYSIDLINAKMILVGDECMASVLNVMPNLTSKNLPKYRIANPYESFDLLDDSQTEFQTPSIYSNPSLEPTPTKEIFGGDAAFLFFTSGTTGLPKASIISHVRWVKAYAAFGKVLMRLNPQDVVYIPLPMYHATAMVVCLNSAIAGGASIVLKKKFSTTGFWLDVHKYKITTFGYVGELCRYLLNNPPSDLEKNSPLTKMMGNGMRADLWMEFKNRFGMKQMGEFYASSEGNIAFFNLFNLDKTIGFTVAKYALVEYDKENDEIVKDSKGQFIKVPDGKPGLLLGEISQKYPFDGYTEKDKTEKVILRNVFKQGDSWFNTGDMVVNLGFNHVQFDDRMGDTFRWKSENVSTTQVENIMGHNEMIEHVVVYGVDVPGNIGKAGMATIVLKPTLTLDDFNPSHYYQELATALPSYAIPVFIRFTDVLETTSTFKYKKTALKEVGYDAAKTIDPIFYLNSETKSYQKIDASINQSIQNKNIKF